MANRSRTTFFASWIGGAIVGGGIVYALTLVGLNPRDTGAPPALSVLSAQGYDIIEVEGDRPPGWRLWNVQQQGLDMLAYTVKGSQALVVGGTLYDGAGQRASDRLKREHHRQHLTLAGLNDMTRWVDIAVDPESEIARPALPEPSASDDHFKPDFSQLDNASVVTPGVIWLADPSDPLVQNAYEDYQVMEGRRHQRIRFIPYPTQGSPISISRNNLEAVFEANYRTPAHHPDLVTEYRGGDLAFTHRSTDVLAQILKENATLTPKAPDGHPAELMAYQSISQNIHLMDSLGVQSPQVFHLSDEEGSGLVMTPLSDWMAAQSSVRQQSDRLTNTPGSNT